MDKRGEFQSKLSVHESACLRTVPHVRAAGSRVVAADFVVRYVLKTWNVHILDLLYLCFFFLNISYWIFCVSCDLKLGHYSTKTHWVLMRGSVLIQGLIGLYPTQSSEPQLCLLSLRWGMQWVCESTVCVCVVLLPCLASVVSSVNEDALGITAYTYLLQLSLVVPVTGWIIHTSPPPLRYHTWTDAQRSTYS